MTGGRSTVMLMSTTKPKVFKDRVTYVTLGKWLQAGLVLASSYVQNLKINAPEEHTNERGVSTFIECSPLLLYWNEVFANLKYASIRREMVLSKIRVDEDNAWGEGCLIFAPVRRNGFVKGTKNRFLPMLSISTPIDSFKITHMPEWSIQKTNEKIMAGVRNWLHYRPLYFDMNNNETRLLSTFLKNCKEPLFRTEDFKNYSTVTINKSSAYNVLHRAEAAGLVEYVAKGNKRQRCWKIIENGSV
jgi:hypothetical protein